MKAIFTTKSESEYDDVVEERYHFPVTYLNQVRNSVGDSIIYYEPRRKIGDTSGGRQAYFAVARVSEIVPNSRRTDHYYARISDYLDFDDAVPFRSGEGTYFESRLQRADGETNKGAFGRAVRNLPDQEFDVILAAGFSRAVTEPPPERDRASAYGGFEETGSEFIRPLLEIAGTRKFRDRAFVQHIRNAYDGTCAMTGLRILNGGGRPEVQAAHIRPVESNGPDSVRNGLALSGTFHWMFDRGLISVGDDYQLLATSTGIPEQIRQLMNLSGRLRLPADRSAWPHPHYLRYHRENVFKG